MNNIEQQIMVATFFTNVIFMDKYCFSFIYQIHYIAVFSHLKFPAIRFVLCKPFLIVLNKSNFCINSSTEKQIYSRIWITIHSKTQIISLSLRVWALYSKITQSNQQHMHFIQKSEDFYRPEKNLYTLFTESFK